MTLSALKRLRALPAIALAFLLAAALVGCSTSEPAEEPATPTPAEEPAASEPPVEEEVAEPEPVDKSQLVSTFTSYSEEFMDEPDVFEATYDNDGRLLTYSNANQHYSWTYDDEGRILTEIYSSTIEAGGESVSTTYTYNVDGTLAETVVENSTPALYLDPETGEIGEDPALGETWQEAGESYRTQWTFTDDGKQKTGKTYTLDGELTESTIYYYNENARSAYDTVSTDPQSIGQNNSSVKPVRTETFAATGAKTGEVAYTYDADGHLVSTKATGSEGDYEQTATYDEKGSEISESFSSTTDPEMNSNFQITWTYNEAGQPATSEMISNNGTNPQRQFFTYDSKGRLKAVVSIIPMVQYDESGEPTEAEALIGCTIFSYLIDDEELSATPEHLMTDARAQVEAA